MSYAVLEGKISALSSSVLKDHDQPKRTVFTNYRDADSDFEDDPELDNDAEDLEMVDVEMSTGSSTSRPASRMGGEISRASHNSEVTVVKSEPMSTGASQGSFIPNASVLIGIKAPVLDELQQHFPGQTVVVLGAAAKT